MNITVSKKDLIGVLTRTCAAAARKSTMPILSHVLLDAKDGALTVSATDLFLSIRGSTPGEVKTAGAAAAPGKDLLERIRMMPDGPIEIGTGKDDALVLKAAGSARRFTLRTSKAEDFPPIVWLDPMAARLALPGGTLGGLIAVTKHAISTDETRPHLNSALFEQKKGILRMVATDGHCLAKAEVTIEAKEAPSMLLPLSGIREIERMCRAETVEIVVAGPTAFFTAEGFTLGVRLADATFPPFDQVIPKEGRPRSARVQRAAFADAIRAVALASPDSTRGLKLSFKKTILSITAESPDSGEGFDEIPIEYTGSPLEIGCAHHYLLEAIAACGGDELAIDLGGELDAIAFRSAGFVGIVMPLRLF